MRKGMVSAVLLILAGCAGGGGEIPLGGELVGGDESSVTFRYDPGTSLSSVQAKADTYCEQYGRQAVPASPGPALEMPALLAEQTATFDCVGP